MASSYKRSSNSISEIFTAVNSFIAISRYRSLPVWNIIKYRISISVSTDEDDVVRAVLEPFVVEVVTSGHPQVNVIKLFCFVIDTPAIKVRRFFTDNKPAQVEHLLASGVGSQPYLQALS